ncbi:hypothetical protein HAU06_20585 [Bacillus toyonensis]|uniref:hypothetical protein n=1 Tax=Bacillus toyonensis TaxID=155322 RepID=UPI000BEE2137|nr:hypothetical protein [Bacillus toyonensis]MBC2686475.1 hypothetical protein [Bacillus toyonensis]PDY86322.1 hypothetical protein CON67_25385 [Bacillus toyonensis]
MRNYYEVVSDLKKAFSSKTRKENAVNLLKENDDLFWDYLSLVHLSASQIYMDEKPGMSLLILSTKFINHTATAYDALLNSMVDEFFILFRQSCEVKWLAQYFIKHPEKQEDWLSSKKNYIAPREVRKAIDEDEKMKGLYSYLSSGAHPKTESISHILQENLVIGGNYDETFTQYAFLLMLRTIDEYLVELFNVIREQHGFDLELLGQKGADNFEENEELFTLAVGQFSILSEKLDKHEKLIRETC